MRVLIIIGAGASFDCWPKHLYSPNRIQKLPLANELFSSKPIQDSILTKYNLMGLASILRSKVNIRNKADENFDVEYELDKISNYASKINDPNRLQDLFKTRFYIHDLISELTNVTLTHANSHTIYVDLLNQLKEWIDEDPTNRFIDIVSFNYDTLLEDGMRNVYGYNWSSKNRSNPMRAYLLGDNLRIYKPHGSINWGREIATIRYTDPSEIFAKFNQIKHNNSFVLINPSDMLNKTNKNYIPAIAVPFKNKAHFEECPQDMQVGMLEAIKQANKIITLGWKGADKNFTDLLRTSGKKIDEVHVVSPKADTYLNNVFSEDQISSVKSTFSHFISEARALETLLNKFSSSCKII